MKKIKEKIICDECRKLINSTKDGLQITTPKGIEYFHYQCFEKMLKRLNKVKLPQKTPQKE